MDIRSIFVGPLGVRAGWRILVWAVIAVTIMVSFGVVARSMQPVMKTILSHMDGDAHKIISEGLNPLLAWGGVVLATRLTWLIFRKDRDYSRYGLKPSRQGLREILVGTAVGVLGLLISAGCIWSMGGFKFVPHFSGLTPIYGLLWLATFVGVAFFEEFFFRGFFLTSLADGIGVIGAAIATAAVFSLAHMGNPNESPAGLVNVILIGIVFAICVVRTGSLWLPVGIHFGWNFAQTFLVGSNNSGTPSAGSLFIAVPHGNPIISGGRVGVEGSVMSLVGMALMTAFVLLTWRTTKFKSLEPIVPEADPMLTSAQS